jgi:hypothetical protein
MARWLLLHDTGQPNTQMRSYWTWYWVAFMTETMFLLVFTSRIIYLTKTNMHNFLILCFFLFFCASYWWTWDLFFLDKNNNSCCRDFFSHLKHELLSLIQVEAKHWSQLTSSYQTNWTGSTIWAACEELASTKKCQPVCWNMVQRIWMQTLEI